MFTIEEFADYARVPVDEINLGTLNSLLREARVLIRGVVPSLSEDESLWPEAVRVVALRVVARGYVRGNDVPFGATSVSHAAEGFSQSFGFSESSMQPGLWLSKQDKRDLGVRSTGGAYMVDMGPSYGRRPRGDVWDFL